MGLIGCWGVDCWGPFLIFLLVWILFLCRGRSLKEKEKRARAVWGMVHMEWY